MVAIVQSDPYQVLSRKIGYSVGLEFLLRNVLALNDIYTSDKKSVTFADWKSLVKETFDRNDRSVIEIANFLSALKLIRVFGNELHILYGLDILSVLKRYFLNDEEKYLISAKMVLTLLLLEADGDIFLNCLAANFNQSGAKDGLEKMIAYKWEKFSAAFTNPVLQHKIWDIISIKSQDASKSGQRKTNSPFEPTGKNPFLRRIDVLGERPQTIPTIADSYLSKVLPTRKGWARDLGYLNESSAITPLGLRFLESLNQLKLGTSNAYCFWPYESELHMLRIKPSEIGAPSLGSWNILSSLTNAYRTEGDDYQLTSLDNKAVLDLLWEIFQLYKQGSSNRGSIRHQIPLYIVKPVIAAICVANKLELISLDEILNEEYRRPERVVNFTNIRGTEGAIIFKSKP